MTKTVRIENADPANYKVKVQEQERSSDGTWVDVGSPTLLDWPTAMANLTIWKGKRLIVEENGPTQ